MTKFARPSAGLAAKLVALLSATPAQAQNNKTFVSSTGSAGGPCTRAAPCISFSFAHDATVPEGEINCLDSGPFGGATITKSITIDCAGTTTNQFIINAAGIVVRLRNLTFNGLLLPITTGISIDFVNGAAVFVENCVIANNDGSLPQIGIRFQPTAPGSQLVVTDTVLSNNGSGTSGGGILVKPASGVTAQVTLNRVTAAKNSHGIIADGTGGGSIRGAVRDSVVSANANNGITVTTAGSGSAVLAVENTTVTGNNFGLVSGGASSGMLVGQSSIVLNNTGLFPTGGGALLSYKNNNVNGNTTADGTFTGVIGQQ